LGHCSVVCVAHVLHTAQAAVACAGLLLADVVGCMLGAALHVPAWVPAGYSYCVPLFPCRCVVEHIGGFVVINSILRMRAFSRVWSGVVTTLSCP